MSLNTYLDANETYLIMIKENEKKEKKYGLACKFKVLL
jgi:hypothetical protein